MEINGIEIYDEEDKKAQRLTKKKNNRKKTHRMRMLIVLGCICFLLMMYFISDMSKTKSLKVSGNIYFNDQEIFDIAGLSYETRYMIAPGFWIENKLEDNELIEKAKVDRSLNGSIYIEIKEKVILGYIKKKNKTYIVFNDGTQKEVLQKDQGKLVKFAYIDGFDDKQLKNLVDAFFNKKEAVSQELLTMISDISPYKESYDPHMVKIMMQDGNALYSSYQSIYLLNKYKSTLKALKKEHVCMVMDEATNTYVSESCSNFKKSK